MTSVAPLPVDPAPTKALPQGEAPRGRNKKASEEGGEGGFAAVLAQALPADPQDAKAARAVAVQGLAVEGGGVVAGEAEGDPEAEATKAPPPAMVIKIGKAAASTPAPQAIRVAASSPAQEMLVEASLEPIANETPEARPAAVAKGTVVEEAVEAETIDSANAPGKEVREFAPVERRPAEKKQGAKPAVERSNGESLATAPVEWKAAAATRTEQPSEKQAAPVRAELTRPEKEQQGPRVPPSEGGAEQKRLAEMPGTSKAPPRVDGAPVIEFQVRRERPAENVRQTPVIGDRAATAEAAPRTIRRQATIERPGTALPPAAPPEKLAATVTVEPIETGSGRMPAVEPGEPRVSLMQRIAAAPPVGSQTGDAQAGRGGTDDAADSQDEAIDQKTQPRPQAVGVKGAPATVSAELRTEMETPKQGPLKPIVAAGPIAQAANGLQTAAPASVQAETSTPRSTAEARPVTPANQPNEPEIAAKLQQQGGRTTLNVVLQDERLGRVALQLVERGGWIETAIRASDPRTAQTLSNGAAGLFEALQQRGLTLAAGSGAAAWDAQEGQRRDNPHRDQEGTRRRFRLRRAPGAFESALTRAEV